MYGKDVIPDPHEMESPGKRKAAIQNADGTYKKAAMNGWAQNYCDGILHHAGENTLLNDEMIPECADLFCPNSSRRCTDWRATTASPTCGSARCPARPTPTDCSGSPAPRRAW